MPLPIWSRTVDELGSRNSPRGRESGAGPDGSSGHTHTHTHTHSLTHSSVLPFERSDRGRLLPSDLPSSAGSASLFLSRVESADEPFSRAAASEDRIRAVKYMYVHTRLGTKQVLVPPVLTIIHHHLRASTSRTEWGARVLQREIHPARGTRSLQRRENQSSASISSRLCHIDTLKL